MKRLATLAAVVLTTLGFVAAAHAQTPVAPLVSKDATTIVRVDLTQIDGATLSQTTQKLAVAAIDYFAVDAEQAKQAKSVAPLAGMFAAQYAETYVAPLKQAGVAELYVIVDKAVDAENPAYPYLAIPTAGLTKEQTDEIRDALKTLNGRLGGLLKYRFARFGFTIVPIIPDDVAADEAKAYVKKRFSKIDKADDAVFAEGFAKLGTGAVVSAVGIATGADPAAQAQIDAAVKSLADAPQGAADFVKKSFAFNEKFVELVRCGAWKLDLNALEIFGIVETKSPQAAQDYLALVDQVKAETTAFLEKTLDARLAEFEGDEGAPTKEDVAPLKADLLAVVDALLDAIQANGATLTWKLDEQFFVDAKPLFRQLAEDAAALQKKLTLPEAEEAEEADADAVPLVM